MSQLTIPSYIANPVTSVTIHGHKCKCHAAAIREKNLETEPNMTKQSTSIAYSRNSSVPK